MFRAPLSIRLKAFKGRSVTAILGYTETDLKERFFMPTARWVWREVFYAGIIFQVVALLLRLREVTGDRPQHAPQ
jgi:hypothetical protein